MLLLIILVIHCVVRNNNNHPIYEAVANCQCGVRAVYNF